MFSSKILERGYDYWAEGLVSDVLSTEDGYEAIVSGSYNYEVEIIVDDDEVLEMYCDCPYAEEGRYCKHMAAVLYELTNQCMAAGSSRSASDSGKAGDIPDTEHRRQEIAASVDRVSEADLRDYVKQLLYKDKNLYEKFKIQYEFSDSREMMEIFKSQIDKIFEEQCQEYGYLDYYHASKLEKQIYRIMGDITGKLMKCGCYQEVFELSLYLYKELEYVAVDESDGVTDEILELCTEIWEELLDDCGEQSIGDMIFSGLKDIVSRSGVHYRSERAWGFMQDFFDEREYITEMLNIVEEALKKCDSRKVTWEDSYTISTCVTDILYFMEELGYSDTELTEFSRQYWNLDDVRRYWISKGQKAGAYEQTIGLIKESLEQSKGKTVLVMEYRRTLMQIYKQMGDVEKYRAELKDIILNESWASKEDYEEYKALFTSKEWEQKREAVFTAPYGEQHLYELLQEEGLYGRLLEAIKKSGSLNILRRYEKILQKEYAEEIVQIYADNIEGMADRASNRSTYKEIVQILSHMKEFRGGAEIVERIVGSWRYKYRKRRAMMEEIKDL